MTDLAHVKFERLMAHVAELEERVADLEKQLTGGESADAQEAALVREALDEAQEQLARSRSELSRLSDGCGRPHPMS